MEHVAQLGNYDRVVHLVFGTGEKRCSLILELYARGNLILADKSYEILALLRSHEYQEAAVQVKVGQVYPVTYATSIRDESQGVLGMTGTQAMEWAKTVLTLSKNESTTKKKKSDSGIPLKALLLKPSSGVSYYGPSLLEDCILCAKLDPNVKFTADNVDGVLSVAEWESLIASLKEEGPTIMNQLSTVESKGYILYRPKPAGDDGKNDGKPVEEAEHQPFRDKILEEFQPHLLKQHEGRPFIEYDNFSQAVDEFFAHIGSQKQVLRSEAAEVAAKERLEKVRKDIQNRIDSLEKEQEKLKQHAQLVEVHAEDVDKALGVINSALDTGMDWEALDQLVEVEQQNENPIALLIKRLDLEKDAMVLALPNTFADDSDKTVDVTVSLHETAYANASEMFARYRAAKEKSEKTAEASTKALKAAEATAQRELANAKKKTIFSTDVAQKRKAHWFEKFHWMITSDNYLVVGGKDAQQNEMLVKRYLRPGDAYLHADVHGASSCILRAKRRRKKDGRTEPIPLPEQALREAGTFTICHSSAWASRMVTSAWWVESDQVSKTAPSGEYLTVGSFMVRGKKNYLPPSQLEMGLAVLFRLGDEDSIARHKNERRDFSLIEADEHDDEDVDEPLATKSPGKDVKINERLENKVTAMLKGDKSAAATESDLADEKDGFGKESEPLVDNDREASTGPNSEVPMENGFISTEEPAVQTKKKGLSVKERKLIKRYGSLEAAEKAAAEREEATGKASPSQPQDQEQSSDAEPKRGKKTKQKRAAKRYADQDDEDRELALLALHAGEKKAKKKNGKKANVPVSAEQEKVAAETAALLVKDPQEVAQQLPEEVRKVLSECIKVQDPSSNDSSFTVLRWEKFDSDILEQLVEMSEGEQLAAAKRLLFLKSTTRVDNFSASLSGIIRTIRKHGHENLETDLDAAAAVETAAESKRKTKLEKEAEDVVWKATLAEEGIIDEDLDEDAIDDTVEISKLTSKPQAEDAILYALPVCAPYQSLSQYKYRVKLTPGNQKRGKAAKQCIEILTKPEGDKTANGERCRKLIKQVNDNEWIQTICADVKISAAGASKMAKKQKTSNKKGKTKK